MKILEENEQSLDDLVVRARSDSVLRSLLGGKPSIQPLLEAEGKKGVPVLKQIVLDDIPAPIAVCCPRQISVVGGHYFLVAGELEDKWYIRQYSYDAIDKRLLKNIRGSKEEFFCDPIRDVCAISNNTFAASQPEGYVLFFGLNPSGFQHAYTHRVFEGTWPFRKYANNLLMSVCDGSIYFADSERGHIRRYLYLVNKQPIETDEHRTIAPIKQIASGNGEIVVAASSGLYLLNKVLSEYRELCLNPMDCVAISKDGKSIAAMDNRAGLLYVMDFEELKKGKVKYDSLTPCNVPNARLAFSQNNEVFVTDYDNDRILLYEK
jgi:hypothetical protein